MLASYIQQFLTVVTIGLGLARFWWAFGISGWGGGLNPPIPPRYATASCNCVIGLVQFLGFWWIFNGLRTNRETSGEAKDTFRQLNYVEGEGTRKSISLLKGLQASPARPSGKSSVQNDRHYPLVLLIRVVYRMRMYEQENVKIVTVTVTVDSKSLLSFTACSDCCVGLFVLSCCVGLFVLSYSAVPCTEIGMLTGREAFCVYHCWDWTGLSVLLVPYQWTYFWSKIWKPSRQHNFLQFPYQFVRAGCQLA